MIPTHEVCAQLLCHIAQLRSGAIHGWREVVKEIQNGVHKWLILNLDQVWRQSLRFGKKVLVKGTQRAFDRLDPSQLYSRYFSLVSPSGCGDTGLAWTCETN